MLEGKIPDRVPVSLFMGESFLNQIYQNINMKNPLDYGLKLIDIQKKLGLDIIARLSGWIFPQWAYLGINIDQQTEKWDILTQETQRGKSLVKKYTIKTPDGDLKQEITMSKMEESDILHCSCIKKPIKTIKDLEIVMKYEPRVIDNDFTSMLKNIISKLKNYLGNDGIISLWIPGGIFNQASYLVDANLIYSLFLTDKLFYEKLMNYSFERVKPLIRASNECPIDCYSIGGNVPGGFLGAKIYNEFVLPYEKKFIKFANKTGIKTIYHNCGLIMNLVESYKYLGADVIEPFSPPPFLGDGNLIEAKRKSTGKYIIIGNIDQVNVLQKGTIDLVKKITRKTVEIGKVGGKFILQSADHLEYGTPLENLEAYIETGIKFGKY